ncbi:MAG: hypothetical protein IPL52_02355 [Flavobacteriales bacterium]|nr:hypothetical protein [Flavobacteriales bacterium]
MLPQAMNNEWRAAVHAVVCCLLLIATPRCEAQNLVPNPSFELQDTCPYTFGFQEGDRPLYWYSWYNSPEYFHACAQATNGVDTLVGVPWNGWTFQYPWEGVAYVGFRSFDGGGDFREYVGAELVEPLVIGCEYQLRFWTNPACDGSYWLTNGGTACDNVGMLFTTFSNAWYATTGPAFPFRNYAHLRTTLPVADTVAWTLVEGTFTADSAYTHVVLGNFFADSLTSAFPIGNPNPWTGITYYLIDEVEVVPVEASCHDVGAHDVFEEEPVLRFEASTISVDWPGELFRAEVLDASGRVVIADPLNHSGTVVLHSPTVQAEYVLRLFGKRKSFVTKFVVL